MRLAAGGMRPDSRCMYTPDIYTVHGQVHVYKLFEDKWLQVSHSAFGGMRHCLRFGRWQGNAFALPSLLVRSRHQPKENAAMKTAAIFECESTLTERYQTTVPSEVRAALKLGKGDKLRYSVSSDAVVLKRAAEPEQEDPVLTQFLAFVANDLPRIPSAPVRSMRGCV